ncbi:MAG: hypothetical protein EOO20_00675 [Chryseobacterium sp.]|nr:MAG: hypothetical protein EOO20_00675 [Chryseobacterium sp.]
MDTGFWIETNWSDSIDNVTSLNISTVFEEIDKTHQQDAVFWIGDHQGLNALQIDKHYTIHYIFGENMDQRLSIQAENKAQCRILLFKFIEADYREFKKEFKNSIPRF